MIYIPAYQDTEVYEADNRETNTLNKKIKKLYELIDDEIEEEQLRQIIRDEVSKILFDLWKKRLLWK